MIQAGDIITAIDGVNLADTISNMGEVTAMMVGPPGSEVMISGVRSGGEPYDVVLSRGGGGVGSAAASSVGAGGLSSAAVSNAGSDAGENAGGGGMATGMMMEPGEVDEMGAKVCESANLLHAEVMRLRKEIEGGRVALERARGEMEEERRRREEAVEREEEAVAQGKRAVAVTIAEGKTILEEAVAAERALHAETTKHGEVMRLKIEEQQAAMQGLRDEVGRMRAAVDAAEERARNFEEEVATERRNVLQAVSLPTLKHVSRIHQFYAPAHDVLRPRF